MRRKLLLIGVYICLTGELFASEKAIFTGSWTSPSDGAVSFSLQLTQIGTRIEGYHQAIANAGKRIDAQLASDGRPSITGTVVNGVAHVHFRSAYSEDAGGEALINLRGDRMGWKIVKSSGGHYLPKSCVLHREKGAN